MAPYKPKIEQPPQPYGLWIKTTKGAGKRPTIIALHGCGGLYTSYGNDPKLTPRHETMARVFTSIGFNVLFPDLFMPRGIYGNCTDSLSDWTKTSEADRKSVESALEWLATQPNVDMNRIVLFGWSYGATVMLNALNLAHTDVAVRNIQPKAAVAFYPYCEPYLDTKKPYKLAAPTEIFVGENDTWTPAKSCERFEERLLDSETQVNVFTYPDTYHDFDAPGTPIYVRLDVNPADGKPGGITAGGNAISRAAAYKEILSFLKDKLQ